MQTPSAKAITMQAWIMISASTDKMCIRDSPEAVHVHQQLRVLHEGAGAQEQQGLHGGDPSQGDSEAVTED